MAENLPPPFTYAQTVDLKKQLLAVAERFKKEHDVDESIMQRELGFICANIAANCGTLDRNYLEWLKQPRKTR